MIIIVIELTKLITLFNTSHGEFDEFEFITSLPITLPIIILLISISKILNKYSKMIKLDELINSEIQQTFNQINNNVNINIIKKEYSVLQKQKATMTKDEYLKKLIGLRESAYNT